MEWNDEIIVRLRALWTEGHSTAEIGRRINVSKNAVVGKAHRLGLTARPSPIRREGRDSAVPHASPARRVAGPTLPPLPAGDSRLHEAPLRREPVEVAVDSAAPPPMMRPESPAVATPVRAVPPRTSRLVACCWPIGEPGTPSFRFCDDDALHNKPYCAKHATLAYVKVRDRRDEAA